jgi:uncharacterized protein YjbI with pentapeptide repeats
MKLKIDLPIIPDNLATITHEVITACQVDRAIFSGCNLEGIDLSDCEFSGLIVEIEDLNGCIISQRHASSFVGLLGLIMK